jgi:DNA-directed RNA polymerase
MDFRGRVYPIPPHLNHMGADIARGILLFSESKPLGERGLYWLKVHLANKVGKDKLALDERVAYVETILDVVN